MLLTLSCVHAWLELEELKSGGKVKNQEINDINLVCLCL